MTSHITIVKECAIIFALRQMSFPNLTSNINTFNIPLLLIYLYYAFMYTFNIH